MDEQIAKLERLCELDPANIAYHQQLARVSKRSGETRYSKLVRDFIEELKRPSWTIPTSAHWITEKLGQSAKDLAPVFALLLDHKSTSIRRRAAWVLPEICCEAMVPGLAMLLKDPDQEMRKTAVTVLQRLGPRAKAATPQLIDAMGDNSHDVRRIASQSLATFGEQNSPEIVKGLRNRDPVVRAHTAEFIGRNKIQAGKKPLFKALDDSQSSVRRASALALGAFGEEASDAVPIIIELLEDEQLPWVVIEALGQIATPQAIEFLENCFQNAWHFDRSSVIRGICHLGAKGQEFLEPLLDRIFREGPYAWVNNDHYELFEFEQEGEYGLTTQFSALMNHVDFQSIVGLCQCHVEMASQLILERSNSNTSYELRLCVLLLLELNQSHSEIRQRLSARSNVSNPDLQDTIQVLIAYIDNVLMAHDWPQSRD